MAVTQFDKFVEVIDMLDKSKVLQNIVLVGSWCELIYEEYFKAYEFRHSINTRDVDFLVDVPPKINHPVDLVKELKKYDFVLQRSVTKRFMQLATPELIVEFLVPERGRGSTEPFEIKALGLNAQPLRMLSMLLSDSILVKWGKYKVRVPQPSRYALHKLMISNRRQTKEKGLKDTLAGLRLLEIITEAKEGQSILSTLEEIPKQWKKKILKKLMAIEPDLDWESTIKELGNNTKKLKLVGESIIISDR